MPTDRVAPEQAAPAGAPAGGAAHYQEGAAPPVRAPPGAAGVLPPPGAPQPPGAPRVVPPGPERPRLTKQRSK